jgi:lipopolysaccharide export system protein LptA
MNRILALLIFYSTVYSLNAANLKKAGPDPLSKITITSQSAVCNKSKNLPGQYAFIYSGQVKVTFADQSTITSENLEVIFEEKKKNKGVIPAKPELQVKKETPADNFKRITFKNNVQVNYAKRKALADQATIFLPTQRCILEGNVKIWQPKLSPKDVPIVIRSSKAQLSLKDGQVSLEGTSQLPVSTTIVLESHSNLVSKNNSKHAKKHG